MRSFDLQQVPPQPAPGDLPTPQPPDTPPQPVTDPNETRPPVQDPDVVDPTTAPDAPMIA